MIDIKDFDSRLLKIEKMSYKKIGINNIGYITIKKVGVYQNTNSVNPLYLIIGEVDGFIEEINGNKYITIASRKENKKALEKAIKIWNEMRNSIKK